MELLLKRNYENLTITPGSKEFVRVKTRHKNDWEHLKLDGFISKAEAALTGVAIRKVACSAWRPTFNDTWISLSKEQYIEGVVLNGFLYILEVQDKPVIGAEDRFNETDPRPKASVTMIS